MRSLTRSLGQISLAILLLSGCDSSLSLEKRSIDQVEIMVTGKERRWTTRYAGIDGELGTDDDVRTPGEIIVPVGAFITIHLRSRDFLYLFTLPHEDVSEIAVPDLEFKLELRAREEGVFPMIGGQMCGLPNTRHGTFRALDTRAYRQELALRAQPVQDPSGAPTPR